VWPLHAQPQEPVPPGPVQHASTVDAIADGESATEAAASVVKVAATPPLRTLRRLITRAVRIMKSGSVMCFPSLSAAAG
jgi:hypothetical protein